MTDTIVTVFAAILVTLFTLICFSLAAYLWVTRAKYLEKVDDQEKQLESSQRPKLEVTIPETTQTATPNFKSANSSHDKSYFDTETKVNDSASTIFYNKPSASGTIEESKTDKHFICVSYDDEDASTDYDSDHFEEKSRNNSESFKSSKISVKMMAERHRTLLSSQGPRPLSAFEMKPAFQQAGRQYPFNDSPTNTNGQRQSYSNNKSNTITMLNNDRLSTKNSCFLSNYEASIADSTSTDLIYELYIEKIDTNKYHNDSESIGSLPPPLPLKDKIYLTRPNRALYR